MAVRIVEEDMGWDRIKRDLLALDEAKSEAGLFGSGQTPDSNVAYRGLIQEFGANIRVTPKMRAFLAGALNVFLRQSTNRIVIPARPFERQAFDSNLPAIKRKVAEEIGLMIDGRYSPEIALARIGEYMADLIKRSMVTGNWTANSGVTTRQKGSSRPLVDDGEMLRSVKHRETLK